MMEWQAFDAASAIAAEGVVLRATGSPPLTFLPLTGGANNRAYRVDTAQGPVLLKAYFRSDADPRDRLAAEWNYLDHVWPLCPASTARPLAKDDLAGLACYEFLEGRSLVPGDVDATLVLKALHLVIDSNTDNLAPTASRMGAGSEACFSLAQHLDCVRGRVERLASIAPEPENAPALEFVTQILGPTWASVRGKCENSRQATRELALSQRCISPSDFGFHNALLAGGGRIYFIDFEYAGWDDPAKLVCDFFCQPRVPVPLEFLSEFTATLAARGNMGEELVERVHALMPVYIVKWTCILLNEYLRSGADRRAFAAQESLVPQVLAGTQGRAVQSSGPEKPVDASGASEVLAGRKQTQLHKAKRMLSRLNAKIE